MKCWLCGNEEAETKEHMVKKSDLKALFGNPTQASPLYFNSGIPESASRRRNVKIGSLKSDTLKYTHRICLTCNSARTQPHDRAWEHCSAFLRTWLPQYKKTGNFRASSIFSYATNDRMLDVHLYFVKLFGCQIVEGEIPIDIQAFSRSIMEGKAHPNLYIGFGWLPDMPFLAAGGSNVHIVLVEGHVTCASWLYQIGDISVNVMYAIDGEERQGLDVAWHPRMGAKNLNFIRFGPP